MSQPPYESWVILVWRIEHTRWEIVAQVADTPDADPAEAKIVYTGHQHREGIKNVRMLHTADG